MPAALGGVRRRVVLAAATLLALSAASGTASASSGAPAPAAVDDVAVCTAQIDNPHFSNGAGSVIFKARMSCTTNGNVPSVNLRVWGVLATSPVAHPAIRRRDRRAPPRPPTRPRPCRPTGSR
ncbi:hypothetical protein [Streptomyces sp. NPDC001250]|uniref:hypothetical protein n=1 Tax=unclassified Streptomyces TaxID=2593676 RepID=UPI0033176352